MTKFVTAEPLFAPTTQLRVTAPAPTEGVPRVAFPGSAKGASAADAAEGALEPTALRDETVQEYVRPGFKAVTEAVSVAPGVGSVVEPGGPASTRAVLATVGPIEQASENEVMGEPPSAPTVHETVAEEMPADA
jgi:hypothetical protein